ncbi:hypothetical protein [Mycolicibacterium goodii]|uniref:hypothetical protein n=1 Tax=Mycolicibacterium goodii TaxID=134601 RepID=UPI00256E9D9C|nr:hypothetical protein [Mycolicibacterium goodii]
MTARSAAAAARAGGLPRWQVRFPLRNIVVAEAVAAALAIALTIVGAPWWSLVVVVLIVCALAVVHYRGATVTGWVHRVIRHRRRATAASSVIPEPFSAECLSVGAIGMRWD